MECTIKFNEPGLADAARAVIKESKMVFEESYNKQEGLIEFKITYDNVMQIYNLGGASAITFLLVNGQQLNNEASGS